MDKTQQAEQSIRNSNRFLTAFHRIEQSMKDIIGTNDHLSFYKLVELSKRKNAVVRRFEEDLKEYTTLLLNAIVHHQNAQQSMQLLNPMIILYLALETIDEALAKPSYRWGNVCSVKSAFFKRKDTLMDALV